LLLAASADYFQVALSLTVSKDSMASQVMVRLLVLLSGLLPAFVRARCGYFQVALSSGDRSRASQVIASLLRGDRGYFQVALSVQVVSKTSLASQVIVVLPRR
jgi:hypothetical protein